MQGTCAAGLAGACGDIPMGLGANGVKQGSRTLQANTLASPDVTDIQPNLSSLHPSCKGPLCVYGSHMPKSVTLLVLQRAGDILVS